MYYNTRSSGRPIHSGESYGLKEAAHPGLGANGGSGSGRRSPESNRNPLGQLIEHRFAEASSPCRSYSELERRSGVSREALSRYITSRADRRRSPTVETLAAIATALNMNI